MFRGITIITLIFAIASTSFAVITPQGHGWCKCEGKTLFGIVIQKRIEFQHFDEVAVKLNGLSPGVSVHYYCEYSAENVTTNFSGDATGK